MKNTIACFLALVHPVDNNSFCEAESARTAFSSFLYVHYCVAVIRNTLTERKFTSTGSKETRRMFVPIKGVAHVFLWEHFSQSRLLTGCFPVMEHLIILSTSKRLFTVFSLPHCMKRETHDAVVSLTDIKSNTIQVIKCNNYRARATSRVYVYRPTSNKWPENHVFQHKISIRQIFLTSNS